MHETDIGSRALRSKRELPHPIGGLIRHGVRPTVALAAAHDLALGDHAAFPRDAHQVRVSSVCN